eukprot:494872-Pleurochrysis_carterae.AAC.1
MAAGLNNLLVWSDLIELQIHGFSLVVECKLLMVYFCPRCPLKSYYAGYWFHVRVKPVIRLLKTRYVDDII